jgi:hypothetical protein
MNSTVYQLPTSIGLLRHGTFANLFARDIETTESYVTTSRLLEAKVHSGDYFITLATELDSIGQDIPDYATRSAIEDAVSDLIYLYDNYSISKK